MKRTTRTLTAVAGLALALGGTIAPAQAGYACDTFNRCGSMTHYNPDPGLNTPILYRCADGSVHSASVGQSDVCRDVDSIYVRPGENLEVAYGGTFGTATGWHDIGDYNGYRLIVTAD